MTAGYRYDPVLKDAYKLAVQISMGTKLLDLVLSCLSPEFELDHTAPRKLVVSKSDRQEEFLQHLRVSIAKENT